MISFSERREINIVKKEDKKKFKYYFTFNRSKFYLAIMAVLSIIVMIYSLEIGIFSIVVTLVLASFELSENDDKALFYYAKELFLKENLENENIYNYFPLPFVILNYRKLIQRYNLGFENLFLGMALKDKAISDVISGIDLDKSIYDISINEEYYRVYIKKFRLDNSNDENYEYILYLCNITENKLLNMLIKREKVVVAFIFIDNYDEVLETVEEAKKPLLIAIIDRKLNSLIQETHGILKSFEKDKYLMIISYDKLEKIQTTHFDILNQIREINIGNKIPITLSIGIGVSGDTLAQSMEYARSAVDLALGRGGDQAIIKNVDKYSFYGGNSKEIEKTTHVRARIKAYALKELMKETENVIIMGHKNPDIDSLGSAIGIFKACQTINKRANIIINEVTTSIKELYDRLVALALYKDYVFIDNQGAIQLIDDKTLLIVVDVHKKNFVEYPLLLEQCKNIVVFDHHRMSTSCIENPVLSYIEPYASSTSELITEILQYFDEKINFESVEADALLGGITVDTKNFTIKTGARTFEAAAFLKRVGADSVRVHSFFKNDLKSYKDRVTTVKDAEIFKNFIAISSCPLDTENPALIAAQAADELLTISGIKASFVMCQKGNNVSISARSMGNINVQVIMEKLGGGGHQTVSGAQLENTDLIAVRNKIKQTIDEYFKEE